MTTLEAIKGAISTRGKNKGLLKAKCPPMNTPEAAAWQAMIFVVNPFKLGICHIILMDEETKALYYEVLKLMEIITIQNKMGDYKAVRFKIDGETIVTTDRDRKALESFGVW